MISINSTRHITFEPKSKVFYISHGLQDVVRNVFWLKLSTDGKTKAEYVSVSLVRKFQKEQATKDAELHYTFHADTYQHVTKNRHGPVFQAITGGIEPDIEERALELNSSPIHLLPIAASLPTDCYLLEGTTDHCSLAITIDKIPAVPSITYDCVILWKRIRLGLTVREVSMRSAGLFVTHYC